MAMSFPKYSKSSTLSSTEGLFQTNFMHTVIMKMLAQMICVKDPSFVIPELILLKIISSLSSIVLLEFSKCWLLSQLKFVGFCEKM